MADGPTVVSADGAMWDLVARPTKVVLLRGDVARI